MTAEQYEAPFWEQSWKNADSGRIAAYMESCDMGADGLIAELHRRAVRSVCDAGCGCGIYTAKLAANGFSVSAFDVSAAAVELARASVRKAGCSAAFRTADVLNTGYADRTFDAVLSREVLDHLRKADAAAALRELYRIAKPGGIILFTLDSADEEYESEPHIVSADGDYLFVAGKWKGMAFHPYEREELHEILPAGAKCEITGSGGGWTVLLIKETGSPSCQ